MPSTSISGSTLCAPSAEMRRRSTFTLIESRVANATTGRQLFFNSERPRKSRFTLIEMLVVITIIAILVSMLLPALSESKYIAKKTACAGHLRQVYTAAMSYSSDYDESLMYGNIVSSTDPLSWYFTIIPYVGGNENTDITQLAPELLRRGCPDAKPFWPNSRRQSYGLNYRLRYENIGERWPRLSTTPENPPDKVIYFADCWTGEIDRFYNLNTNSELIRTLTGEPTLFNRSPRHLGRELTTVFIDGNYTHLKEPELWTGYGSLFWDRW